MTFKLQGFGAKESSYERPNQPWLCGSSGETCRLGPDEKGRCPTTAECAPVLRNGRWQCTRPASRGGPCEGGPLPTGACARPVARCQPVRSLRARRGLVVRWASVVTLGLVLFAFGASRRADLLTPGDLGFQHGRVAATVPLASLLTSPTSGKGRGSGAGAPAAAPSCGDCHVASRGALGRIASAFGVRTGDTQSTLCLRCHELGATALKAHNVSPAVLAREAARAGRLPPGEDLPCATCHLEHRGQSFQIAFMDDVRCQACHAMSFASLASGHPEFTGYPYRRGMYIKFDHNKHKTRHFLKAENNREDRPFVCGACHMPDSSGRNMLVRSFEETCTSCHATQIGDNDGIPFLSVPGFDPALAKTGKARIGEWPNKDEGDLSPFMRVLLSGDADEAAYLGDLKGVDLLDLGSASGDELEAVQSYAWGVKRLFVDVSLRGHEALTRRLGKALNRKGPSGVDPDDLVGELPLATVRDARRAWFPRLVDETKGVDSGAAPPASRFLEKGTGETEPGRREPKKWLEAGGWYRNDLDFTVRYHPARHADPFVRAWIDAAAALRGRDRDANRILDSLTKPTSPGRCLKCHTIGRAGRGFRAPGRGATGGETNESAGPAVARWTSKRPDASERGFTKFAHTTHLSVLGRTEVCSNCHLLAADAPAVIQQSPLVTEATGDFVPMQKSRCVSCHVPRAAGDNCVLCHNYHVGIFASSVSASIGGQGPSVKAPSRP